MRVRLGIRPREGEPDSVRTALGPVERRLGAPRLRQLLQAVQERRQVRTREIAELLGVSVPTARAYLRQLEDLGLVSRTLRSPTDPGATWEVSASPFWSDAVAYWKAT